MVNIRSSLPENVGLRLAFEVWQTVDSGIDASLPFDLSWKNHWASTGADLTMDFGGQRQL